MNTPIRVLQITDCIKHGSGVSEVIMNYYRFMNTTEVLFDFMVRKCRIPESTCSFSRLQQ